MHNNCAARILRNERLYEVLFAANGDVFHMNLLLHVLLDATNDHPLVD